ncbi:MAG: hypothetical protein PHE20_01730 [Patescibacteria group bacterium]|nr:hypothetical protein [Patescibacteria group bacterium]
MKEKTKVSNKQKLIGALIDLLTCAMLFATSFVLEPIIKGSLPFSLYFSIVYTLLTISKIDLKITGSVKIRHLVGHIIMIGIIFMFTLLSAVDWIFISIIPDTWHYLLTLEGSILFCYSLLFSIRLLGEPNYKTFRQRHEEGVAFT